MVDFNPNFQISGFKPKFDLNEVKFGGNHSDSTKKFANNVHQKIQDSFAEQDIKAKVVVSAGFKDGQPILYITAYDNGKPVIKDAENAIQNNLPDGASLTVYDHKAEILLRE
ncbi:hypothetical protein NO1_0424 [Candidatus Termititenax aidoneus]|uniref:Uncharacterized protein n=1 Tax=Termititenax aidoneus TaxID=2218524 RepID=A0A388T9Q7_TERA1|nr:hypothetical protein NO1_0424 [Candidatus Termititenax aidoneus]